MRSTVQFRVALVFFVGLVLAAEAAALGEARKERPILANYCRGGYCQVYTCTAHDYELDVCYSTPNGVQIFEACVPGAYVNTTYYHPNDTKCEGPIKSQDTHIVGWCRPTAEVDLFYYYGCNSTNETASPKK
ncbi:hypothetical protein DIPPA_13890 [Diplonema papillatum]|nr:hypothetical protein DIPPA_13890 [Diplonema papillatum]